MLFVQQGDLAAVAVVAAHLAVGGGVEGGGGGGGGGVPWRGEHGLGLGGGGGWEGAVVLILVLASGRPVAKGLALGQLVPQGRDSFLLLEPQQQNRSSIANQESIEPIIEPFNNHKSI